MRPSSQQRDYDVIVKRTIYLCQCIQVEGGRHIIRWPHMKGQ